MTHLLRKRIKKTIINGVKEASFFSVFVDETIDTSKKEQLAVFVCYVNSGIKRVSNLC